MDVLQIKNITKRYFNHVAVDDVSFNVPEKSVFGLLGPNGAGKTTLIRIITQIIHTDEGSVTFMGKPLAPNHQQQIGYMPEERGLYSKMRVDEHIIYLAQLKGLSYREALSKMNSWTEKFDLSDWRKRKVNELSKGMQQKVQFISTIIHEPDLLIFDEPFSGLDPVNVNLIKDEITRLKQSGVTVILSTHRMERVEEVCDDIVLINQGKKVLEGKVGSVKEKYKKNEFEVRFSGELQKNSTDFPFSLLREEDHHWIVALDEHRTPNDILQYFIQQKVQIKSFNEILPSLDEVFIESVQDK